MIHMLALTCSRSQQHVHDSETGLHHTAALPETECQDKDCTAQSYKIHTRDTVLRARLQLDHLNTTIYIYIYIYIYI